MKKELKIELVPEPLFGVNLRSKLTTKGWDIVRRTAYKEYDYKCAVCGGVGKKHPVEAHELWIYDDCAGKQYLSEVIAVCPACHECFHLGCTMARRCNGKNPESCDSVMNDIELRLIKGWGVCRDAVYFRVEAIFALHARRSEQEGWIQVLGSHVRIGQTSVCIADLFKP